MQRQAWFRSSLSRTAATDYTDTAACSPVEVVAGDVELGRGGLDSLYVNSAARQISSDCRSSVSSQCKRQASTAHSLPRSACRLPVSEPQHCRKMSSTAHLQPLPLLLEDPLRPCWPNHKPACPPAQPNAVHRAQLVAAQLCLPLYHNAAERKMDDIRPSRQHTCSFSSSSSITRSAASGRCALKGSSRSRNLQTVGCQSKQISKQGTAAGSRRAQHEGSLEGLQPLAEPAETTTGGRAGTALVAPRQPASGHEQVQPVKAHRPRNNHSKADAHFCTRAVFSSFSSPSSFLMLFSCGPTVRGSAQRFVLLPER